ncbi:triose-phosphate isomerase [bacterium]|nr:triose-phosphate isomerase [bacterium]
MRTPVIAGNWKMNKTVAEAVALASEIKEKVAGVENVKIIVCPVFTAVKSVADVLKGTNVKVGAQDMYWETSGAYTGEVSGEMLMEAGAEYVIIGHSERRQYFGETNETVNKKLKKALSIGLKPIVCIGETLADREAGTTEAVVRKQVKEGFVGLTADEMKGTIIAYEPVWAIGTGKTATAEQAEAVHAFVRNLIAQLWDKETADAVIIQYGGSMKPENVASLLAQPDIDGGLIGGAALKADSFEKLVKF